MTFHNGFDNVVKKISILLLFFLQKFGLATENLELVVCFGAFCFAINAYLRQLHFMDFITGT